MNPYWPSRHKEFTRWRFGLVLAVGTQDKASLSSYPIADRPVPFRGVRTLSKAQRITTFLWFDANAEEAAYFYTSIFDDAKIVSTMPGPGGKPMGVTFQISGQEFTAFNGGPMFKLTEAISLFVNCETQADVDNLWNRLTADGGAPSRCGWLKDKFGLSWQIIPRFFGECLAGDDRKKAGRMMQAAMQMSKFDIAALKQAYDGT